MATIKDGNFLQYLNHIIGVGYALSEFKEISSEIREKNKMNCVGYFLFDIK
jgi:hypothetical protein